MKNIMTQKVLVVDDNEDVRELVGLALKKYRVSFASDGEEGLKAVRSNKPDLIVLDIMMPRLDGYAFLKEIAADKSLRFLKVIVLSAKTLPEDILKGYSHGAIDYVTKPFKKDLLVAKVDQLIQMRFSEEIAAYQNIVWTYLNHHVSNNLGLMKVGSSVLKETTRVEDEAGQSSVSIISEAVQQLSSLVEQGTFLNALMTNPVKLTQIDPSRLLEGIWKEALHFAGEAGGRDLKLQIAEACPVMGERGILRRAFMAAITDAINRTEIDATINVRVRQELVDCHVSVEYGEISIPGPLTDELFMPYHIDQTAPAGIVDGFSLGLPIAHLATRLCGGDLSFRSSQANKTVLSFIFPLTDVNT